MACPLCGANTFVGSEKCDACGRSLMVQCENKRCNEKQYFLTDVCTACGKKIKHAEQQITDLRKGTM